MRKFKHKITGNIATETLTEKNYKVSEPKNFTIPKWIIENSNEWEEIIEIPVGTKITQVRNTESIKETSYEKTKEGWYFGDLKVWIDESDIGEGKRFQIVKEEPKKDWEILKIKNSYDNNVITFNSEGEPIHRTDGCSIKHTLNLKDCLNTKNVDIFQVKRLSDGEIFTIRDKIQHKWSKECGNILKINLINNNNIFFNTTYMNSDIGIVLYNATKLKNAFFITEDNVSLYEPTECHIVNNKLEYYTGNVNECVSKYWFNDKKIFSNKTKAEEFILLNKPILSITEVLDLLEESSILGKWKYTKTTKETIEAFKKLVKSKL